MRVRKIGCCGGTHSGWISRSCIGGRDIDLYGIVFLGCRGGAGATTTANMTMMTMMMTSQYESRCTFPGRIVIGPDAEPWNKGGGGSSDNHDNRNDHDDNNNNDSTVRSNNQSTREIMESSS